MELPLESVPNFSEGRDRETIDALAGALSERAELLDVHSDPDHNRSVFTLVGAEEDIVPALLSAVGTAKDRIDLRRHEGAHPRIGAADVVPIVALDPADAERARRCAPWWRALGVKGIAHQWATRRQTSRLQWVLRLSTTQS